MLYKIAYNSPIGVLHIEGTVESIHSIMFTDQATTENVNQKELPSVILDCYEQLDAYFKGQRQKFTFPFTQDGTAFQQAVWCALADIPYATTCSYKELAQKIGKEQAVRAVGSANGKNRLSIVIPCHRIIGANGKLTGYAGGLWRKEWLLQHERNMSG